MLPGPGQHLTRARQREQTGRTSGFISLSVPGKLKCIILSLTCSFFQNTGSHRDFLQPQRNTFKCFILRRYFFPWSSFSFIFCVCFQTCRKALLFPSFVAAVVVVSLPMLFFPISEHPCWFLCKAPGGCTAAGCDAEPLSCWASCSTPRSFEAATSHPHRRIMLLFLQEIMKHFVKRHQWEQ